MMMASIRIKLHGKTLKIQQVRTSKRKKKRKRPPRSNKIERSTTTSTGIRFKLNYRIYWVT